MELNHLDAAPRNPREEIVVVMKTTDIGFEQFSNILVDILHSILDSFVWHAAADRFRNTWPFSFMEWKQAIRNRPRNQCVDAA